MIRVPLPDDTDELSCLRIVTAPRPEVAVESLEETIPEHFRQGVHCAEQDLWEFFAHLASELSGCASGAQRCPQSFSFGAIPGVPVGTQQLVSPAFAACSCFKGQRAGRESTLITALE